MTSTLLLLLESPEPAVGSSLAVVGLSYRGVNVQDFDGGIFLELEHGLEETASVRGVDSLVEWAPGMRAGNRVLDVLDLELRGEVFGEADATSLSTFRQRVDALADLFDLTVAGPLVARLEDGSTRMVVARATDRTFDQVNPMRARVSIPLESVTPEWA